jgi:hypothetical protein
MDNHAERLMVNVLMRSAVFMPSAVSYPSRLNPAVEFSTRLRKITEWHPEQRSPELAAILDGDERRHRLRKSSGSRNQQPHCSAQAEE